MDKNTKIYKSFSAVKEQLKKSGAKHVKLTNLDHEDIVSFNFVKKPVQPKITEIEKKLQLLPDGIYCVVAVDRFGKKVHQDNYYVGKGNYEAGMKNLSDPGEKNNSENLLSLDSAVKNIKEASQLSADNSVLKNENEKLKAEILELKGKVSHLESVNNELSEQLEEEEDSLSAGGMFGGLGDFLKELSPVLPSIADRYFDLQTKRENLKEAKFLADNGYELPNIKKKAVNGNGSAKKQIPLPGSEEWEEYVNEVSNLPDEKFFAYLEQVKNQFPEIYEALAEEVLDESEENE